MASCTNFIKCTRMIDQIKTVIEAIGLSYFRALNPQDLNEQAIKNSMQNIGVLAGLIDINATFQEASNKAVEQWEFTIMFLTLAPNIDSPAEEIDALLGGLYDKAHEFLALYQEVLPSGYYLEGYELESTDSINITNEVLIGWELKISAPYIANICPPIN